MQETEDRSPPNEWKAYQYVIRALKIGPPPISVNSLTAEQKAEFETDLKKAYSTGATKMATIQRT